MYNVLRYDKDENRYVETCQFRTLCRAEFYRNILKALWLTRVVIVYRA